MEAALVKNLEGADANYFLGWLAKQPRRQIDNAISDVWVERTNSWKTYRVPRIFALIHFFPQGEDEVLEKLLDGFILAGCDINEAYEGLWSPIRSAKGFTPLIYAIEQKNLPWVKTLIKKGADLEIRDAANYTALHWTAFATSKVDYAKCLMEAGAKIHDETDVPPVLHVAVDEGRLELVAYLVLTQGADVNTKYSYKVQKEETWLKMTTRYNCPITDKDLQDLEITAVGRAVRMRKLDILNLLLRHPSAQVSIDDIHFCILEGDSQTANIILEKFDKSLLLDDKISGIPALFRLGPSGFDKDRTKATSTLVRTYIEAGGFDINCVVENQTLLLKWMMNQSPEKENLDLLKDLLELGANPLLPNCSLFNHAVRRHRLGVIDQIVVAGYDITTPEHDHYFHLFLSTRSGKWDKDKRSVADVYKTGVQLQATRPTPSHLYSAIKGDNEYLVLHIVSSLPEDVKLEYRGDDEEDDDLIRSFFDNVMEVTMNMGLCETNSKVIIDCAILRDIFIQCRSRGYKLSNDLIMMSLNLANCFCCSPSVLLNASALFDEILNSQEVDWASFLKGGMASHQFFNYKPASTEPTLNKLLDAGVPGEAFPTLNPKGLKLITVRKAWWAGAKIQEGKLGDKGKQWMASVTKEQEGSLMRLSALAIRKSLKYNSPQALDQLGLGVVKNRIIHPQV